MKPPKISLTMIVRDEVRTLGRAIASVRPHVDQIVVVDTGSTDGTRELLEGSLKDETDIIQWFTECNIGKSAQGLIDDFSLARNKARELAFHPIILWMDADDIMKGGENLRSLVKREIRDDGRAQQILFPYHYDRRTFHWRERVVYPASSFRWEYPVHEVLGLVNGAEPITTIRSREVEIVHEPHPDKLKVKEVGRNLRILRAELARKGYLRPREMFYMVQESLAQGRRPEAIRWAETFLATCDDPSSGISDDEQAICWLWLSDLHGWRFDHEAALRTALRAHTTKESWPSPLLRIGSVLYERAFRGEDSARNMRRALHFFEKGLACPEPVTDHFQDPNVRLVAWQRYAALLQYLGRLREGLIVTDHGLHAFPNNPELTRIREEIVGGLG